jgi:hypothetical protein
LEQVFGEAFCGEMGLWEGPQEQTVALLELGVCKGLVHPQRLIVPVASDKRLPSVANDSWIEKGVDFA